jgi:hypothetical protein
MAKEVNLGRKPTQQELLARVTGKGKVPPPPQQVGRRLPPGVTGDLPLPSGKVVYGVSPASLTPAEREALTGMGWTEESGVPIPHGMADVLEKERAARAAQAEEVVLPVDPRSKPVEVQDPVDISKVSPEDRERLLSAMKVAFDREQQLTRQTADQQTLRQREAGVPGLGQAVKAAERAARASDEPLVEDDRGQTASRAGNAPGGQSRDPGPIASVHHKQPGKAEVDPDEARIERIEGAADEARFPDNGGRSQTGADVRPAFCEHCQWPYGMPDIPEPAYGDKLAFVHALLGQKPFTKDYELFGGQLTAVFRTLTTREIDVVYRQAWRDRDAGRVVTEIDYWERTNRYRLFLQLSCLKSPGPDGFVHDLPDGLSREANPGCTATWNVDGSAVDVGETPLPLIEEYVVENVLKTEHVFRVVNNACNQFNRLVAKMEAMADNTDFWRPTEAPS